MSDKLKEAKDALVSEIVFFLVAGGLCLCAAMAIVKAYGLENIVNH